MPKQAKPTIKLQIKSKTGNKKEYKLNVRKNLIIATCTCGAQFLVRSGKDANNRPLRLHLAEHKCASSGETAK